MDSVALFKALGDSSRLEILKILLESPLTAEELCGRLKLVPSTISHHANKLIKTNLIRAEKNKKVITYHLIHSPFNQTLLSLIQTPTPEQEDGRSQRWRKNVLKNFIQCGKLLSIPAQRKKRRVILEHILQEVESDTVYSEKEFNLILKNWHEDHCFLRREMIAEGLIQREQQEYWRIDT